MPKMRWLIPFILSMLFTCSACQDVADDQGEKQMNPRMVVPASLGHSPRAIAWLPDGSFAYTHGYDIWANGSHLQLLDNARVSDVLAWDDGLWFSTSTPINAFRLTYDIVKYDGEQFEVVYENSNLMDRRDGTTLFTHNGELIWTNGVEERVLNLQRLTTPRIINDHQLLLHQSDRLEVYDVLTHSISQTYPVVIPASSRPVVSPDGLLVAWIETSADVSTMKSYNFLTGKQIIVTDSYDVGLDSEWYRMTLAWSPNSDALAFIINTQETNSLPAGTVWVVNVDGIETTINTP